MLSVSPDKSRLALVLIIPKMNSRVAGRISPYEKRAKPLETHTPSARPNTISQERDITVLHFASLHFASKRGLYHGQNE